MKETIKTDAQRHNNVSEDAVPFVLNFDVESFHFNTQRAIGRLSASAGLLKALCNRYGRTRLFVSVQDNDDANAFIQMTQPFGMDPEAVSFIRKGDLPKVSDVGAVLAPSPQINNELIARQLQCETAFSVVGMTHSICSRSVMQLFSNLYFEPVNCWDAMICTSKAARQAVHNMFESYGDYLSSRGISAPKPALQLPVIPLGIHLGQFERGPGTASLRNQFRRLRNISDSEIVILCFGRLDPFTKMHPVPLFQAVEQAQIELGDKKRLNLLMVGQAPQEEVLRDYLNTFEMFAPSVRVHWIDGKNKDDTDASWFAADMFCSLADNVQETFGLTPVQAMASSLPSVVSDWSGYRDTVQHNITGFRIPTYSPTSESSLGVYFADRYSANVDPYPFYVGGIAQTISVDVRECAEAIVKLALDDQLRIQMGTNGLNRARALYSWPVVLKQYTELFGELANIRNAHKNEEISSGTPAFPTSMDPYRLFGHFASQDIDRNRQMLICDENWERKLDCLANSPMCVFIEHVHLSRTEIHRLLKSNHGKQFDIETLNQEFPGFKLPQITATCMWLLKYSIIRLV